MFSFTFSLPCYRPNPFSLHYFFLMLSLFILFFIIILYSHLLNSPSIPSISPYFCPSFFTVFIFLSFLPAIHLLSLLPFSSTLYTPPPPSPLYLSSPQVSLFTKRPHCHLQGDWCCAGSIPLHGVTTLPSKFNHLVKLQSCTISHLWLWLRGTIGMAYWCPA